MISSECFPELIIEENVDARVSTDTYLSDSHRLSRILGYPSLSKYVGDVNKGNIDSSDLFLADLGEKLDSRDVSEKENQRGNYILNEKDDDSNLFAYTDKYKKASIIQEKNYKSSFHNQKSPKNLSNGDFLLKELSLCFHKEESERLGSESSIATLTEDPILRKRAAEIINNRINADEAEDENQLLFITRDQEIDINDDDQLSINKLWVKDSLWNSVMGIGYVSKFRFFPTNNIEEKENNKWNAAKYLPKADLYNANFSKKKNSIKIKTDSENVKKIKQNHCAEKNTANENNSAHVSLDDLNSNIIVPRISVPESLDIADDVFHSECDDTDLGSYKIKSVENKDLQKSIFPTSRINDDYETSELVKNSQNDFSNSFINELKQLLNPNKTLREQIKQDKDKENARIIRKFTSSNLNVESQKDISQMEFFEMIAQRKSVGNSFSAQGVYNRKKSSFAAEENQDNTLIPAGHLNRQPSVFESIQDEYSELNELLLETNGKVFLSENQKREHDTMMYYKKMRKISAYSIGANKERILPRYSVIHQKSSQLPTVFDENTPENTFLDPIISANNNNRKSSKIHSELEDYDLHGYNNPSKVKNYNDYNSNTDRSEGIQMGGNIPRTMQVVLKNKTKQPVLLDLSIKENVEMLSLKSSKEQIIRSTEINKSKLPQNNVTTNINLNGFKRLKEKVTKYNISHQSIMTGTPEIIENNYKKKSTSALSNISPLETSIKKIITLDSKKNSESYIKVNTDEPGIIYNVQKASIDSKKTLLKNVSESVENSSIEDNKTKMSVDYFTDSRTSSSITSKNKIDLKVLEKSQSVIYQQSDSNISILVNNLDEKNFNRKNLTANYNSIEFGGIDQLSGMKFDNCNNDIFFDGAKNLNKSSILQGLSTIGPKTDKNVVDNDKETSIKPLMPEIQRLSDTTTQIHKIFFENNDKSPKSSNQPTKKYSLLNPKRKSSESFLLDFNKENYNIHIESEIDRKQSEYLSENTDDSNKQNYIRKKSQTILSHLTSKKDRISLPTTFIRKSSSADIKTKSISQILNSNNQLKCDQKSSTDNDEMDSYVEDILERAKAQKNQADAKNKKVIISNVCVTKDEESSMTRYN
ncbi:hypothetical protein BB561_004288, partial [Smittium simulii]